MEACTDLLEWVFVIVAHLLLDFSEKVSLFLIPVEPEVGEVDQNKPLLFLVLEFVGLKKNRPLLSSVVENIRDPLRPLSRESKTVCVCLPPLVNWPRYHIVLLNSIDLTFASGIELETNTPRGSYMRSCTLLLVQWIDPYPTAPGHYNINLL